ncbi:oxygen-dependent tRNA uridine(34) hydroxylase TrhO [Woodsholea maritima]|uniref:oxygen-dependent tRNA uridine(34) hydroxylase TrhO n=1 Tax=Woodsholea maritima TaxID=240237 RepID=UPI0012EAB34F|nr:rhodanese-related sulfurtransferase [Woodsholea maritima]
MTTYTVAALYKFTPFANFEAYREPLLAVCEQAQTTGTLLLAHEGINGTIAGPRDGIDAVLDYIRALPGFADLDHKESYAHENPFFRMKVRLKKEIVTMGVADIDPLKSVGTYVEPKDWNELIQSPDVITIDTRNDYEVSIGQFDGAIDPKTTSFREFPDWFKTFMKDRPNARIAMYCTGGIRCEKSTAFVKSLGIDEVYHLKGGILKYLETVPQEESLWKGECFVFDQRVSVGHGLVPGPYDQCHACRHPIDDEMKASPKYVPGVSCPLCYDEQSEEQRQRYAERQKQMQLAKQRGKAHIGAKMPRQT